MKRALLAVGMAAMLAAAGGGLDLVAWSGQQQATPPVKATVDNPLDLNKASEEALQTLPGVGPAMAARIVEYREKNGGFTKIEELMNVKGIGEKTFLKLKPLVRVPPKTRDQ